MGVIGKHLAPIRVGGLREMEPRLAYWATTCVIEVDASEGHW